MAFGIGIHTDSLKHHMTEGPYKDVAVKCWFTSTGRSMPLMMKVETSEEELLVVDHIQVVTAQKQYYGGIVNWKYACRAPVQGRMKEFILLFCPDQCSWRLLLQP